MRLLLWGLAAAALLATEPGKRLQQKAVDTFKRLKGKALGSEAGDTEAETKGDKGDTSEKSESIDVGANGKPTKKENATKDEKPSKDGKRKLRAVSNDEKEKGEAENHEAENDQAELEASRVAMKDSIERHPEMGEEENEDELEEPRIEEEAEDKEADDEESSEAESGDEEEHGIDPKKANELLEKLNAKPSAPEDELKSA